MRTFRHLQFAFYVITLLFLVQESEQAACEDKSSVTFKNQSMTCAQVVQDQGPNLVCFSPLMKGECCHTCDQLKRKNQGNTACPYGDLGYYLFKGQTTPTKCDNPSNKKYCKNHLFYSACCKFCSEFSSSSLTIEPGVCKDVTSVRINSQALTCAQAVQYHGPIVVCNTTLLKDLCCNTCDQLKQKNQGNTACKDVASVMINTQVMTCAQAVRFAGRSFVCVSADLSERCCNTCDQLKLKNQGNTGVLSNKACKDVAAVTINTQNMTCAQAVRFAGRSFVCVNADLSERCCDTCDQLKLKNQGNTACEDMASVTVNNQVMTCIRAVQFAGPNFVCNSSVLKGPCCHTCEQLRQRGNYGGSSPANLTVESDACKDAATIKGKNQNMTCAQVVQKFGPHLVCTNAVLKGLCCNFCKQLKQKNQGNTACPYGDLGIYLLKGDTTPSKCDNNPSNKYLCRFNYFRSACCNFCSSQ